MKILLDTNALLWQLGVSGSGQLGGRAQSLIRDADVVFVSSISLVEMHIKAMLGRLDAPKDLSAGIVAAGDVLLDFSAVAADAVTNYPSLIRHDPFDRMLLAQAASEGLLFLTADQTLLNLQLDYVIDAKV